MLGSRQQGNDGILYGKKLLSQKGSRVFVVTSCPQGNDGILYNYLGYPFKKNGTEFTYD